MQLSTDCSPPKRHPHFYNINIRDPLTHVSTAAVQRFVRRIGQGPLFAVRFQIRGKRPVSRVGAANEKPRVGSGANQRRRRRGLGGGCSAPRVRQYLIRTARQLLYVSVAPFANLPIVPLLGDTIVGSRLMKDGKQKSPVTKRSIVIDGHKTSISLEDQFWDALREIATARGLTTGTLVSSIDADRRQSNLSSAIRLFVLDHYRAQVEARRPPVGPFEKGRPLRSGRP